MSNPTANFGWVMPTSTDLVTDLPADFAVFGQGVDTTLADLKGGTTGQVLSKASNTDMDFTWVAQDDSNAIQNAIVDAKGDLIAATAADTPARLAVGTNGQVLTADSTASTGLAWATLSTGVTFAGVSLYNSGDQTISSGAGTNATFDTELFDTNGYHSTSSNTDRITIPTGKAGYYLITGRAQWFYSSTGQRICSIRKNAGATTLARTAINNQTSSVQTCLSVQIIANLAEGDYVTFENYQDGSGSLALQGGSQAYTTFNAFYLGA